MSGPQDLVPTRTWSSVSFACPKIDHNAGGRDRAGKTPGEGRCRAQYVSAQHATGQERDPSLPVIAELGHSMQVAAGADGSSRARPTR